MISHRSTEEQGTDRRARVRRGIKKRGILPSFGDLVLPIVSVAAVGLLILAGRQFFINGIKTSPGITSTRAYADSPALIAERQREAEMKARTAVPVAEEKPVVSEAAVSKDEGVTLAEVIPPVASVPAVQPTSTPAPQKPEPAKKIAAPAKSQPEKIPMNKQWRVQIGAYTSRAGAEEAVKKLKRAGYKSVIYSNPASKHFKVWLEGGPTKFYADRIVEKMKQLGYKSSFSFPPAK